MKGKGKGKGKGKDNDLGKNMHTGIDRH